MSEQDKLIKSMKSEMGGGPGYIKVGASDDDLLKKLKHTAEVYSKYRKQFDNDWDDNFKSYVNKYNDKLQTTPTTSKLHLPVGFTVVENWLTKVGGAFHSGDRVWECIPSRSKDASRITKPTQYLLDYQTDIYGWDFLLDDYLKTIGIYGIGWMFFGWELTVKKRVVQRLTPVMENGLVKRDPFTGEPEMTYKTVKEPYIDQDRPQLLNVHPKEVFWDPKGRDVDSCKYIYRQYFLDVEDIEDNLDRGVYNRRFNPDDLRDFSAKEREVKSNTELENYNASDEDRYRKRILVQDFYKDDEWYTVLNENTLAKKVDNQLAKQKKPIVMTKGIPIPFSMKPLGEIDIAKPYNIEKNTIRNMRLDQVSLDINQMYLYDKNADVDEKDLISRPNGFVGVRPINGSVANAVVPLRKAYVQAPAYQEEGVLQQDIQDATGQLDYAIGKTPERREAARTVGRLQDAALSRFDITKVRILMHQMKEIPKMIMLLNKTYLTGDSLDVRIYDRAADEYKWEQVRMEDIDFDCDFRYPGSLGKAQKLQRRNELREMIELVGAYQNAYTSQGGRPIFDIGVMFKHWAMEGEWADLAREAVIQKQDTEAPVSPQTMQKAMADKQKGQSDQQAMQIKGQQMQQEMQMKGAKTQQEMASKDAKSKHEMALRQKKAEQEMVLRQMKAEQDAAIAQKKANYGPESE